MTEITRYTVLQEAVQRAAEQVRFYTGNPGQPVPNYEGKFAAAKAKLEILTGLCEEEKFYSDMPINFYEITELQYRKLVTNYTFFEYGSVLNMELIQDMIKKLDATKGEYPNPRRRYAVQKMRRNHQSSPHYQLYVADTHEPAGREPMERDAVYYLSPYSDMTYLVNYSPTDNRFSVKAIPTTDIRTNQ